MEKDLLAALSLPTPTHPTPSFNPLIMFGRNCLSLEKLCGRDLKSFSRPVGIKEPNQVEILAFCQALAISKEGFSGNFFMKGTPLLHSNGPR